MPSNFNPAVPTGLVNLDVDYANIQANMQQLDTTYGVDHFAFSNQSTQNGIHKQVTMVNEAAPGLGNGTGVLFTTLFNSSSWPAWQNSSSGAGATLLTSYVGKTLANGYCSLSSGMLLQWGIVNGTHGTKNNFNPGDTGLVTFATSNQSFLNNCFAVWTQILFDTSAGGAGPPASSSSFIISPDFANTSKTGFNWQAAGSGGSYTKFFWVALGN